MLLSAIKAQLARLYFVFFIVPEIAVGLINTTAKGSRQAQVVLWVDKNRYDNVQGPTEHKGISNKVQHLNMT